MLRFCTLEQAQDKLMDRTPLLDIELVDLLTASGRVLADDIFAGADLPPADQSAVDGFALGYGSREIGSQYRLTGSLRLDEVASFSLQAGEAVRVMTGGTLPAGSQAVIAHERNLLEGNLITLQEKISPGMNTKQAGEDFRRGERLLSRGQLLDPGAIALLSAFGICQVAVHRLPRVAILSLGANAVPCQTDPLPGQVRDSNSPMLAALAQKDGAEIVFVRQITTCRQETLLPLLSQLLEQVDLIIATGGTYAGDQVEALQLMTQAGVEPLYWNVAIQPGNHQGAGIREECMVISLSGNPAACAVGYHLFATPVLLAMVGKTPYRPRVTARCINPFAKKANSRRFVRSHATWTPKGWQVETLPGQKPSMLRSLLDCNALIDIPAGSPPLTVGTEVSILLLDNSYVGLNAEEPSRCLIRMGPS